MSDETTDPGPCTLGPCWALDGHDGPCMPDGQPVEAITEAALAMWERDMPTPRESALIAEVRRLRAITPSVRYVQAHCFQPHVSERPLGGDVPAGTPNWYDQQEIAQLRAALAEARAELARYRPVGWAALDRAARVAATGSDGSMLWIGSTREDVLEPAGEVFVRDPEGTPGGDT